MSFSVHPLTDLDIQDMERSGVLTQNCPVDPGRLKLLKLTYYDFEGDEHFDGEMVVLDAVASKVLNIFRELHQKKFPVAKINLMNVYHGDDDKALADNNTSAFCDRYAAGDNSKRSMHAYGLAFDINPLQNPYIHINQEKGTATYKPEAGILYANRKLERPNKIYRPGMAEEIVDICKKNGFTIWGGDWDSPIDYQHFQVPRELAEPLANMNAGNICHN